MRQPQTKPIPDSPATGAYRDRLWAALNEVDRAKNQSFALGHLIEDSMILRAQNGQWTEEFADKMTAALIEIQNATSTRLENAVNEAVAVAFPNRVKPLNPQ